LSDGVVDFCSVLEEWAGWLRIVECVGKIFNGDSGAIGG